MNHSLSPPQSYPLSLMVACGGRARYGWGFCDRMTYGLGRIADTSGPSTSHPTMLGLPYLPTCGREEFHGNARPAARFGHHPVRRRPGVSPRPVRSPDRVRRTPFGGRSHPVRGLVVFRREDLLPRSRFDTRCFNASSGGGFRMVAACHCLQPGGMEAQRGCPNVVSGQPLHEDPVAGPWRPAHPQSVHHSLSRCRTCLDGWGPMNGQEQTRGCKQRHGQVEACPRLGGGDGGCGCERGFGCRWMDESPMRMQIQKQIIDSDTDKYT
jgi:hypothetical protein